VATAGAANNGSSSSPAEWVCDTWLLRLALTRPAAATGSDAVSLQVLSTTLLTVCRSLQAAAVAVPAGGACGACGGVLLLGERPLDEEDLRTCEASRCSVCVVVCVGVCYCVRLQATSCILVMKAHALQSA
jgi:hypothetical protein